MGFFRKLFSSSPKIGMGTKPVSSSQPHLAKFEAIYFEQEAGWDRVKVVGESSFQSRISKITGRKGDEEVEHECIAALIPLIDEEDQTKVAVHIPQDNVGQVQIGYLSSEAVETYYDAISAAWSIDKLLAADARIYAYPPEEAETLNAGVSIYLPSPEELMEEII